MAHFQYIALDKKGEQTTGVVEANSEAEAISSIREQGLYPTNVVEQGKGSLTAAPSTKKGGLKVKGKSKVKTAKTGKVKLKSLMIFTRQLATLIESGLPLLRSLTVLEKQEPNPAMKATIASIADSVQSGATFSESLAQHPRVFNKLYINMVKAGELGGVMETVLIRLAEYMEKAQKLKSKIVSAMVYPCIVLFIAVAIVVFLMLVIVPQFRELFEEQKIKLPALSEFVFNFSDNMLASPFVLPNAAWLLMIVFLAVFGVVAWGKTEKGGRAIDAFKLRMPLFGSLQRKSAIAKFSRTLGTLVTSGVPILQALNITKETSGNAVVADAIGTIHSAVKEGESIVTPMQANEYVFPSMVISMVDVGEETGKLPEMLVKVADVYEEEVDNSVGALTSIMEPLMIVFLAGVVGVIVLALFMPLVEIMDNVGK